MLVQKVIKTTIIIFCCSLLAHGTYAVKGTYLPTHPALNNYISSLLNKTFSILHDESLSMPEKTARSEQILHDNLDLNWMALYTLGRNRRILLPAQVQQYVEVYKRYIVETYGASVKLYDGQKVTIMNTTPIDDREFTVQTVFVNISSGQEISVEYRVRKMKKSDEFKVFDIVTEGISLVQSQHSEFNSLLSNHGFDKLIEVLTSKADKADAEGKKAA